MLTGAVCGLIAWGGIKVELRWLRRDIDATMRDVRKINERCISRGHI